MKSQEELQQVVATREREFIVALLPFVGVAIAFWMIFTGTLALGQATVINTMLGGLLAIAAVFLVWKLGPRLKYAHGRYRKAQTKLHQFECTTSCCQERASSQS